MRKPPAGPERLDQRPQPGRLRAIFLAIVVHAAFFALIVFGVSWQNKPSAPMEAELWDKLPPPPKAPPRAEPPKPQPPEPEPPKPQPAKPEPAKPEPAKPAPAKPEPPKPDPEIAERKERERREKERAEQERIEREKQALEEAAKRKRQQEAEAKKKREEEARRKREEEAQKKREEEAQKRREEEAQKKREEERRAAEERARQSAEKARAEAASAREKAIAGYVDRIRAKIRGTANVPDTVRGNPEIHVRIRILPGGEVLDVAVTRRSGNAAYDTAIERAIRSASPLPVPPANSELFPVFRDLNLQIQHER